MRPPEPLHQGEWAAHESAAHFVNPLVSDERQPPPPQKKHFGFIPRGKEGDYVMYTSVCLLLLAWAGLTETGIVVSVYAPSPSAVCEAFAGFLYPDMQDPTMRGLFAREPFLLHVLHTIMRVYGTFVVGSVGGIIVGMLAGRSLWWGETFQLFVGVFNVLPRIFVLGILVAGIPFYGPLLGSSGVVLLTLVTTFCMVGNTSFAIARDDTYKPDRDSARALGMNELQMLFLVEVPVATPPLIAAMRAGAWITLGTVYFGEFMIAPDGVGAILSAMVTNTREAELYATVVIGLILVVPMFFASSHLPLLLAKLTRLASLVLRG
jgi:osmoprotectant transport system permease protein